MGIPSYRRHKPSGRAVVTLSGRDHYLGDFGGAESRQEYDRLISLWLANDRKPLDTRPTGRTVADVIREFTGWARRYYRKDGRETSHMGVILAALHDLNRLFGGEEALEFGPAKLDLLMSHWVRNGVSRELINRRAKIVRQAFRHGAYRQMVPAGVWDALRTVPGLRRGRTEARETPGVGPVPKADVEAVMRFVGNSPLAAMILLQLHTGMRPGEVTAMCGEQIDRSNWIYRPATHKMEHSGKCREIPLGPPVLVDCPVSGKALFARLKEMEKDTGRPVVKLVNEEAAKASIKGRMIDWTRDQIEWAWGLVIGQLTPSELIGETLPALRMRLYDVTRDSVKVHLGEEFDRLDEAGRKERVKQEINNLLNTVSPGEVIDTLIQLTDRVQLDKLIDLSQRTLDARRKVMAEETGV